MLTAEKELRVSEKAEKLKGSEIIKLAREVNDKISKGEQITNLTIGDFNPQIYAIPEKLKTCIAEAYQKDQTNYPPDDGVAALREQVSVYIKRYAGLNYQPNEVLITGGARPIIYSLYQTIVDPGDKVIFPIPSWNNNHYCHLHQAQALTIETKAENNFMPLASDIAPLVKEAALVALCSPLNPTGTMFGEKELTKICELIIEENKRRAPNQKPLYLLFDQIYWKLTYDGAIHQNPVSLRPEMRDYTIFVDGLSKAFAATGLRVGWTYGPKRVIDKMKAVLGHIGAWAPKPEQVAVADFLTHTPEVESYLSTIKNRLYTSLLALYNGFSALKEKGYPIAVIKPQSGLYLSVYINLKGYKLPDGEIITNTEQTTFFLLNYARLAIVPFKAFGTQNDDPWYRISVGNCKVEEIPELFIRLEKVLAQLSK